jgi:hypothetical protein
MRKSLAPILLFLLLAFSGAVFAETPPEPVPSNVPGVELKPSPQAMTPEAALAAYHQRMQQQSVQLASYSDTTLMQAQLPDTSQAGEYELQRKYSAPNQLQYTPVRFTGDGFVKSNVMLRLLQSEVEHVTKQQGDETAISEKNYKFNLKSVEDVDGHRCYVFQVKPHEKKVGLFKGRVFIDAETGAIRRAEGTLVKSPSWWIKKVEFVQDYAETGGFVLPSKMASISKVRVVGRTVVNIFHKDYQTVASSRERLANLGGGEPR